MAQWSVAPATILDLRRDRMGKVVVYVAESRSMSPVVRVPDEQSGNHE